MTTKNQTYDIQFKSLPDADGKTGLFEAIVSVFGNVDLVGDKVMPVAFDRSIAEWKNSGDLVPLVWSHDWGNPHAIIGSINPNDLESTPVGLKAIGSIDLNNPFAAQVHSLMQQRLVKEFSFSYVIRDERTGRDGSNELWDLQIIEVGPTLKGANPETELIGVKSKLEFAAKAGRTISASNMKRVQEAHDLFVELGAGCTTSLPEETTQNDGKAEDLSGGNAEDQTDEIVRFRAELAALE